MTILYCFIKAGSSNTPTLYLRSSTMKELTCAFTLTLVSLVAATPHGYGVKGGASAKAEASAIAVGLEPPRLSSGIPLSIPSGVGFTGSFSKSASSSFASSSASSSSSSFSFSGAGSSGLTGFGLKSDGGCSTGGCHNKAGTSGSQQLNGGANAAATAGASALAISPGSSKDSSPTCTSNGCSNQPSGNLNSEDHLAGDEKTAFLESDSTAGSRTSEYGSNNKCTSGKCGLNGQPKPTVADYKSSSQFEVPSISYSPETNCASGECGSNSQSEVLASNYEPGSNCASGKCLSSSQPSPSSTNNGPSEDCASGKCGFNSQPHAPSINYGPSGDCTSGKCESGSQSGLPSSNYGTNRDCASGQCRTSSSPVVPSNENGHPEAASPSTDLNSCKSGQCEPNTVTGPASPNYEPDDIPVIISGSSIPKSPEGSKVKPSDYDNVSIDCSFGNCGQSTSPNVKPSYPNSSSKTYQNDNLAYQNQGSPNFGYNPTAFGSGLASGYNKPASYLTTPKQGSSYNPSKNFDTGHVHTPSDGKTCTGGKCDYNPSNGLFTSTDSGTKCTSSNCTPNTYNNENPKNPSYSAAPGYQVPTDSGSLIGSANCGSGNCATYPSAQPPIGFSSVSAGQYKPSYAHNHASQQTPLGPTGSAELPSMPSSNGAFLTVPKNPIQSGLPSFIAPTGSDSTNCKTPNCASYPSTNINTSAGANIQPGVPSLVSISKPGSPDQKLPVYSGGFGGPPGILKPNEFSSVSIGINKPDYPPSQSNQHFPTGATAITSQNSGFGTSPTVFNNPSVTNPGVPSYNAPTGSDSTNCKTPNCGSYPSTDSVAIAGASAGATSESGVPSFVGSSKPNSSDQKLPVYTDGFGGPAGFLKPNEISSVSIGINKPAYPPSQSSHHIPTGATGIPSQNSGFGTSPILFNNPSVTQPGVPPYNIQTGSDSTNCKTLNCGSYPSAGGVATASASTSAQSGVSSSVISSKPSSSDQKLPVYTGGFGGAAGFLKPNDFSLSTQVPASHSYSKPTVPSGAYNPATCTTGNCGSQSLLPHLHGSFTTGAPVTANAAASANAKADAVAYTGGFGGPPGLLKPYDDGKLTSGDLIKHPSNSQFGVHQGVSSSGIHSSYGSDNNKYDTGSHAVAGAQASAIASASSGAVSGSNVHGYGSYSGHADHDQNKPGGCGGGCAFNAAGSYSSGGQFGYNGGVGLTKPGYHDGLGSSLSGSGSGVTARNLAGAVSGSNAFGASGSFASSSTTAHASAGAGTKGSHYGR